MSADPPTLTLPTINLERFVTIAALTTFTYYLTTFAFEVGFFWQIGLGYMSSFSIGDHTIHAAAYIIGTVGAFAFLYLVLHIPALIISVASREEAPPEADASALPSTRKEKALVWATRAPAFIIIGGSFLWGLYGLHVNGMSPSTLAAPIFLGTFLLWMIGHTWTRGRRLWIVPAFFLFILAPFAIGQMVFERDHREAATGRIIKAGDRRVVGSPIFMGAERMIALVDGRLYLTSYDREFVVRISPDAHGVASVVLTNWDF